jgi:glutaminyl-tRNA synthetase
MRDGKYADGEHVLRAKIDMAAPNIVMRDPVLYRIRHAHHHRTGDKWCIYPMYDFTHCISDAIENITHSLCTLEFENNRPLYDWVLEHLRDAGVFANPLPHQYEFARLNLTYAITSKRKLKQLVDEQRVTAGTIRACPPSSACAAAATRPSRSSCSAIASACPRPIAGST